MQSGRTRYRVVLGPLVAVLAWSWAASAHADDHIRGVITGRGDAGAVFVETDAGRQTTKTFIAQKVTFTKEDFRIANEQAVEPLAATNARPSSLDDFTPVRSITVYFDNGKFTVSKDQKTQLQQMAKDARGLSGYMIQVAAYASALGSEPDSQRLSMERANAVTAILQQSGVPPANVIVPAAMGINDQIAPNITSKGQPQNRRAVVTLLQNKGITGQ